MLPLSYAIDAISAVTAGDEGWDVGARLTVVAEFAYVALVLAAFTFRRRPPGSHGGLLSDPVRDSW